MNSTNFWKALLAVLLVAAVSYHAQASLVINAQQIGPNVVFSYNGSVDLTGAGAPTTPTGVGSFLNPGGSIISFQGSGSGDEYTIGSKTWDPLGAGGLSSPSSHTGDVLQLTGPTPGDKRIVLPLGYVSGNALSGSMTFNGATYVSLGLTQGTYIWDISFSGGPAQTATFNIGEPVPEPATFVVGLSLAAIAYFRFRRRKTS